MPFGIKSAPNAFQRIMSELIGGCSGTLVYLDDILVAAPDKETLHKRVQIVRGKLDDVKIVVNEEKSVDCSTRGTWLSLEISEKSIEPTIEKADQIAMLRAPRNRKEVRQLLGIVNYYRKFMSDMAATAEPIYALLKDKKKWKWNKLEED